MSTILISMYNFKGGVGKTTATFNIGYVMQSMGLKVLMVDADPQMNLTALVWPDKFELKTDPLIRDQQSEEESSCILDFEIFNRAAEEASADSLSLDQRVYRTIGDIFRPLTKDRQPQDLSIGRRTEINRVVDYKGLYFIPGSVLIADLENKIVEGIEARSMLSNVPGYISNIFREIGRHHEIDVVLFDLNPGLSAFNQALIMGSDYFIHPCTADYFSVQALQTIKDQLPKKYVQFHEKDSSRQSEFGLVSTVPKLLGVFPQKVRTRKKRGRDEEELEYSYKHWVMRLNGARTSLEKNLKFYASDGKEISMLSESYATVNCKGIRDFVGMGLSTQTSGRPLSDCLFEHRFIKGDGGTRNFGNDEKIRKESIYSGFVEVVTMMAKNFSPQHFQELPIDFKRIFSMVRNIQVKLGDDKQLLPETPKFVHLDDEPVYEEAISLSSYEDSRINKLFRIYRTRWSDSVFFGRAVTLYQSHSRDDKKQILQTKISKKLELFLENINGNNKRIYSNYIFLLPIAIQSQTSRSSHQHSEDYGSSNLHWILLSASLSIKKLEIDEDVDISNAFIANAVAVFNPVPETHVDIIGTIVHSVAEDIFPSATICETHGGARDTIGNSGIWVVEWADMIARVKEPPRPGTNDINEKRKQHHSIITSSMPTIANAETESISPQVDRHWYDDDEIIKLLRHYLAEYDTVAYLDPMLGTDWGEDHNTLADNLRDYHIERKRSQERGDRIKDKVIIPVNLSQGHWVLVYAIYSLNSDKPPTVYYFDSIGSELWPILERVLGSPGVFEHSEVVHVGEQVQYNGYDCGPWIIEAARGIASNGALPDYTHNIEYARWNHSIVLADLDSNAEEEDEILNSCSLSGSDKEEMSESDDDDSEYSSIEEASDLDKSDFSCSDQEETRSSQKRESLPTNRYGFHSQTGGIKRKKEDEGSTESKRYKKA